MFRLSKNRSNAPCSFVSQCTKRDKRADAKSTLNSSSSFYSVRVENNNACNSIRFPSFLNFTSYYYTFYFPFLFLFSTISLSHRCISHVYSKIRSKIRFASLLTTSFPGNQRRIKKKKKRKLFHESNFRRRKIGPIGSRGGSREKFRIPRESTMTFETRVVAVRMEVARFPGPGFLKGVPRTQ